MALARRPSNANASFFHGVTFRGVCSFVVALVLIGVIVEQEHRIVTSSSSSTSSSGAASDATVKSRSTLTKEEKQKQRRQQRQEMKEKVPRNSEIQSCPKSNPLLIPNEHKLSDKAIFFHMGKAAGGTIFKGGIQCNWRMVFDQCHPHPCVNGEEEGKMILINMRDPVDRFISSFYWEMHRHCSEGDTRKGCLTEERDGYKTVVHTYNKDPNKLAKDLCSSDKKTFRKAKKNLRTINHVEHDIADWLKPEFLLEPENQHRVYPIIMDASVDVMEQTDKAAAWLHNTTSFEDPADFFQRKKLVRKVQKRAGNSTKFVHHASGSDENVLTPENEACLVQFYKKDYKLLSKVKKTLCKNGLCKTAIKAILDRRSDVLKSDDKEEDENEEEEEEEEEDDDNNKSNDSDDEDNKKNTKSNDKNTNKKNKKKN